MKKYKLFSISIIVAIYVVLCLIFEPISFGIIQFRISEILCLLSIEFPYAIIANTIGCFISNLLLGGLGIIDAIFGSLATFLACLFAYLFKEKQNKGLPVVSCLAIVLINGLIVGIELGFVTNNVTIIPITILEIAISEFIVIMCMGLPLYKRMIKAIKDRIK